jgi:hypothetical protein
MTWRRAQLSQNSDREIETMALFVVEEHGEKAGPYAANRVIEHEMKRAHADALRWTKILAAIHRLQELGSANPTKH